MFNIPNIFTAFNLLSGCMSIIFALSGNLTLACYAIFAGAVFDFFDGFLARLLKQQGEFGKQMDSLADIVSFGVAPGILVFSFLAILHIDAQNSIFNSIVDLQLSESSNRIKVFMYLESLFGENPNNYPETSFLPFLALIIPFFSIFRLTKFNLDTRQTENFIGLPTPANAIFFTSFPLIYLYAEASAIKEIFLHHITVIVFVIAMSLMLVSELPLFSLKLKKFDFQSNKLRYITALVAIVCILLFKLWALPIIILFYIVISAIDFIFVKKTNNEI